MTSAQGRWTKQPDGADPRDLEGEELKASVDAGTLDPTDAAQADATHTDPAGYPHDPNPAVGPTPTEQRLRDLAEEGESRREAGPEASD